MKEQFINRYKMSKTLRFSLIPVGKTEENFNSKKLLEEDRDRAEKYENVKKYIDMVRMARLELGIIIPYNFYCCRLIMIGTERRQNNNPL